MAGYKIVRMLPDKSQLDVATVDSKADITRVVDTPQFVGTWLSATRKLLRYGRGEIRIIDLAVEEQPPIVAKTEEELFESDGEMRIYDTQVIKESTGVVGMVELENAGEVRWLEITPGYIAAYDSGQDGRLWKVSNFSQLTVMLDNKEVAYQCKMFYDHFIRGNHQEATL